jgi:tight adherence protein B
VSHGLLMALTFVAGALLVRGLASVGFDLVRKDRTALGRRLDEEFRAGQRKRAAASPLFRDLARAQANPGGEEAEPVLTPRQRAALLIERAGLTLTPERLLALTVGCGVVAGLGAGLLRQSAVVGLAAALAAAPVPVAYVHFKRRARLDRLLRQLPDAFDMMARVIRAGQTTEQAVLAIAEEFDQPLAGEFAYCAEQQNLGLAPERSFRDLARRTGLLDIKIFVLALLIQQQTGGNLAEILDKLAGVVRERFRVRAKVRALTAEGRMQALVLLVLPFALLGIMMLMSAKYAETVVRYPELVGTMVVIETIGAVWIRRVVNFDF